MNQTIHPVTRLKPGTSPIIPGDKSISHRSLMFGALAAGETEVRNLLESADVLSTWGCLERMGAKFTMRGDRVFVQGLGATGLQAPREKLDCGNSGTTMRLMMGILSGQPFRAELFGDESLSRRPMKRIAGPLRKMGARIELTRDEVCPLVIEGKRPLAPIDFELPVASAQLKSAVLLAGLFADGRTRVSGLIQSRDHTERLLPHFGVEVGVSPSDITIVGGQRLRAAHVHVPGDISSAAFWIAGGLLVPGSRLELENISLNPSRMGILSALARMGARIEHEITATLPEEVGRLRISAGPLRGTNIEPDEVPALIDEIPMIAVLATQAEGETVVRGAEELRVKETDRIEAVAEGLRRMGAEIETFEDGFRVRGKQKLKGARIDSHHDHRIAMAFSIAGLIADGPTEIEGAECVSISYPTFYPTLRELAGG